jgi:tRNA A-37 threonylcarbamoyl transferase component Bud32
LNMTPDRWAAVKSILTDALQLPPPERAEFVGTACGSDIELQREIHSLISADNSGTSLPVARAAVALAVSSIAERDDATRELLTVALGNQYHIIRELGRGGMGAVYLAREKALDRLVAIKVLRSELAASADSRERFRREARIVANLSHPGILQLHTFGEVGGIWYFVMSYVRGESLGDLLRRRNRLPWTEAHRILLELSDALACAHRYPVVHRDIKPANILIEADSGRTVLTDFGISKLFGMEDTLTASGAVVGTPHYMSPEQTVARSEIDERSDIYSLGAVGYRMLAGREPFSGETASQLMYARLVSDPASLATLNPDVPEELAAAIMKCLARDPPNRWDSATSLSSALTDIGAKAVDGLPEGVRDIPSYGPYAVIWCTGFMSLALLAERTFLDRALLLFIAVLVPTGLLMHVWLMGVRGIGTSKFLRVALRPPDWWSMYWPRTLRRPTDVWPRLPLPARLSRIAMSSFFLIVPTVILSRDLLMVDLSIDAATLIAVNVLTAAFALACVVGGFLWARRHKLSGVESFRLITGSTAHSAGWESDALSQLLSPVTGRVREPQANDAEDYARAIRELATILPHGAAHLQLVVVSLAADAVEALRRQSDEIGAMQEDTSRTETDRLNSRLAALGPPRENETEARGEMRLVLSHELELVGRIRDRMEIALDQRDRRFDRLRSLYLVLCETSDGRADAADIAESCGRVMGACAELRAELEVADA